MQRNYAYLIADMVANAGSRVPGTANLPKGEFLRRILLGECAEEDIRRYRDKYAVPDRPCFALAVSAEGEGDMAGLLAQYAESDADCAVMIAPKDGAFIKFTEADSEYQSSADFANFLAQSFQEELGIRARVGIGCTVRRFEDVAQSYTQASVALRMSAQFNTAGDVHSYREFVLIRMLEELPAARRAEYLSVLLDGEARELLKDEDLASTAGGISGQRPERERNVAQPVHAPQHAHVPSGQARTHDGAEPAQIFRRRHLPRHHDLKPPRLRHSALPIQEDFTMDVYQRSLALHKELRGKYEIRSLVEVKDRESLSLAYTPGVAQPCKEIAADPSAAYLYTRKWNTVAVVSDGSAVLGLGNIGGWRACPSWRGRPFSSVNSAASTPSPSCFRGRIRTTSSKRWR